MKIIKNLKGEVEDSPTVGVMVAGTTINIGMGNFIRHAQLSNLGILIRRKDEIVLFPMDELVKIAESANPALVPPKVPEPAKTANQ
jgi:hypothetical protein